MALRYWVGSGSTGNWNATGPTNWGSQSGIPSNASIPTNLDDVIFDGAGLSGQSNAIISAAANIKSLTIENSYTGTIGHNAVLTVSSTGNLGNLTLSTGYTITGTSNLNIGKDCVISSNGKTWPNNLAFGTGSSLTVTLSGSDFNVGGQLSISSASALVFNATGITLNVSGGAVTTAGMSGNGGIRVRGGNLYSNGLTATITNVILDGNVTIGNSSALNYVTISSGILTYSSGTIDINTYNSVLRFNGSVTANTSGMSWNDVVINTTSNSILVSDLNVNGLFTQGSNGTIGTFNTNNNSKVFLYSGASLFAPMNSGSADIYLKGGIWRGNDSTSAFQNNLFIDGDVTLSGANTNYGGKTLKYLSGNVILTGATPTTQTLGIRSGCTLDISAITLNNFTNYNSTNIITLNSNLNISGLCRINTTATINTGTTNAVVNLYSGISINAGTSGTAKLIFSDGIWLQANTTYGIGNNLDIAGNVIITGVTTTYGGGLLRYVSGNVTITTASTLNIRASSTFDTSGLTWNRINFLGVNTLTLNSDLNVNDTLTITSTTTINTGTTLACVNLFSGLTMTAGLGGTGIIDLRGGRWFQGATTYALGCNLNINGDVQLSGTNLTYSANTLRYVSGNVIVTGSTLNLRSNCVLDTSGMTWNNVTITATSTTTLNSNLNVGNLFTVGAAATTTINTGITNAVVNLYSGMSINAGISGTAKLVFSAGTWAHGANTYGIGNGLDIVGNVTITGITTTYGGGTLRYVSGNVTITTASTLNIRASSTLDTSGMSWNNINLLGSNVLTLNSDLNINNLFLFSASTTANTGTTLAAINLFSGLTVNSTLRGNAKVKIKNGNWGQNATTYGLGINLDIDGDIRITGANHTYSAGTLTYVSGNIITTGSTFNIFSSCTLDTNGITWNNFRFIGTNTTTLNSNLNVGNLFTINANTTINTGTTNAVINLYSGMSINANLRGNTKLIFSAGTWAQGATTYSVESSLDIVGDIRITGSSATYGGSNGILRYISGNVITTGSTFNIFSSCTLDTSGMTWNSVRTNGTTILNLISDLNVRGPFNIISALNVTGNTGAAVNALTGVTANTAAAITLNNNINSYGLVTVSTTSIINSGTTSGVINIFSGLTLNAGTSGTGKFVIKNGAWSQGANTYVMGNVLEIDGNMSIGSNATLGSNCTLRYVSGNPNLTGSTINIRSNCNFDTSGFTLGLISTRANSTITIFSNLCASFINLGNFVSLTINSGNTNSRVICRGISRNARGNVITGNVEFYLTGGTYDMFSGNNTIVLNNNTYIDGNVNFVSFNWSGNSNKLLKYLSGTVTAADLSLGGSTVAGEWAYIDIGYNVVFSNNINIGASNYYLISPLRAFGNLGMGSSGNHVFGGVAGFHTNYLWVVSTNNNESYSSMNLILKADPNIEYFFDTYVVRTGNSGALVVRSDTPGVRAKLTKLSNLIASTNAEFRDIDNSNGYLFGTFANPISAFTNNNCLNIKHYQDIPTITGQMFSY